MAPVQETNAGSIRITGKTVEELIHGMKGVDAQTSGSMGWDPFGWQEEEDILKRLRGEQDHYSGEVMTLPNESGRSYSASVLLEGFNTEDGKAVGILVYPAFFEHDKDKLRETAELWERLSVLDAESSSV